MIFPRIFKLAKCEYTKATPVKETPKMPTQENLKQAAELIKAAKRPFIYSGGGVVVHGRRGKT